jgi:hypothetical protein
VKSKAWDEALLAEHRAYIRADSARDAFDALVGLGVHSMSKVPFSGTGEALNLVL